MSSLTSSMLLGNQFVEQAIRYCETTPHFASNTDFDTEHAVNTGRFFVYAEHTPLWPDVQIISHQFLSNFDSRYIREIRNEQYPHAFSCIYEEHGKKSRGVFKHIDDQASDGWYHLRINILLQSAEAGGDPIISNRMYTVKSGESWSLWAGRDLHSATPVQGNTRRVLFSLGYHVTPEYVPNASTIIKDIVTYAT